MSSGPIAVYCGSSNVKNAAYDRAARSVGTALARANRGLVYGGGSSGLMGAVSQATLDAGGSVTGVVPAAMLARRGGEGGKAVSKEEAGTQGMQHGEPVLLSEKGREQVETVVVDSMHDRKVIMAQRATGGFVGLPGGYGTFEELLEVVTWSQLSIHNKPVVVVNVLDYFAPLRQLVQNGVREGFIGAVNESLLTFVDGPADLAEHASFDWGTAVVQTLDHWKSPEWDGFGFDWSKKANGRTVGAGGLDAV